MEKNVDIKFSGRDAFLYQARPKEKKNKKKNS